MMNRNFMALLRAKWDEGKFVCVGLDTDITKIPECVRGGEYEADIIVDFNKAIVNATKDLVCAYKPNTAFYEAYGSAGVTALRRTIEYIHAVAPDVPVILDAKRADIGNTNAGYVDAAFGYFKADAITVHPYLGAEALQPFLDCEDKGIIVLCRTSNKGAGEFQDRRVFVDQEEYDFLTQVGADVRDDAGIVHITRLFKHVAYQVSRNWNKNSNCLLVVGATYPGELQKVRSIVGGMPILIPGIGAQGGDVEKTVLAGRDSRVQGMIINSSRGIIYASNGLDFAEAARAETLKLHNLINEYRNKEAS